MKRYFLLFIPIISILACNKSSKSEGEISKIEIVTGRCFGPCQSTVVSIDSTLAYKYYGGGVSMVFRNDTSNKRKLKGYYSAKISQAYWDELKTKFEDIDYKQLDTSYQNSIDDQSLEVFIHYGNKLKHITARSASLPEDAAKVFYYVINSYKTIKPKPSRDTFSFELGAKRPGP
jgi:hypothetical protein